VANQLLQTEGSAKAGLVVSTRAKEFKRTPPNLADLLNVRKLPGSSNGLPPTRCVRINRRNWNTKKSKEDLAWAKAVIPDFDIAMTISNSNKREKSMETAQPASKKAKITNFGTWSHRPER